MWTPCRPQSRPNAVGVCTFSINSYNSVAYFQMVYALALILITGLFVSSFEPDEGKTKQTQRIDNSTVGKVEKTLKQGRERVSPYLSWTSLSSWTLQRDLTLRVVRRISDLSNISTQFKIINSSFSL